jgi:hypothetical protein
MNNRFMGKRLGYSEAAIFQHIDLGRQVKIRAKLKMCKVLFFD